MIVLLFGQPHSGKSTIAQSLQTRLFIEYGEHTPIIDGDEIRDIFKNKDFSREGRLRNLQRISDIATFLSYQYSNVIISAVYPYISARKYLADLNENNLLMVQLTYDSLRGREKYHVQDFENMDIDTEGNFLLNTDRLDLVSCTSFIFDKIKN